MKIKELSVELDMICVAIYMGFEVINWYFESGF
jgi:hypothetical protein